VRSRRELVAKLTTGTVVTAGALPGRLPLPQ